MGRRISTPSRSEDRQPAARRRGRVPLPVARPGGIPWRAVSAVLSLVLVTAIVVVFVSPAFYVTSAEVGGTFYVQPEELFTRAGIAGLHILWVEPDQIEARLLESPALSTVDVSAHWPARVVIVVRERQPALIWQQREDTYWADVNGILMLPRADVPELIRVVNESDSIPFRCPGPACTLPDGTVSIEPAVVQGAQQLQTLRPEITVLYYDPVRGLGYDDPRGWRGYMGSGTDMTRKLNVYEALITDLAARGIRPEMIDVSDPTAPVYRTAR